MASQDAPPVVTYSHVTLDGDGHTVTRVRTVMGPGELHLGDDVEARPDAQGRVGHDSGTEGDEAVVLLMLPLAGPQAPIV